MGSFPDKTGTSICYTERFTTHGVNMIIPRAVVFDLDGTLLHTLPDIASSCNHALSLFGLPTLPDDEVMRYVGNGARELLYSASRLKDDDPRLDRIVDEYIRHYQSHPVVLTEWMPHARDAIEQLSSMPLAICSNKPRSITDRILHTLRVEERFAVIVGGGDTTRPKPSPDALRFAAAKLRVDPGELVMVGDGPQDVLCGRAAGARTVAISNGYSPEAFLRELRPDMLLKDLHALPDVVIRWTKTTVAARRSFHPE